MVASGVRVTVAAAGMVVANVSHLLSYGAAVLVLGGIFTVGTLKSIAWAWKEEKDAAVEKAERLAAAVKIADDDRAQLRTRVGLLEKQTNFDTFAKQLQEGHREIVATLKNVGETLTHSMQASDRLIAMVDGMDVSLRTHTVAVQALADRCVLDEASRALLETAHRERLEGDTV